MIQATSSGTIATQISAIFHTWGFVESALFFSLLVSVGLIVTISILIFRTTSDTDAEKSPGSNFKCRGTCTCNSYRSDC